MKPLLFVAPALPDPPTTGGEIFNRHLVDGLSRTWKLRTLTRATCGIAPDDSPEVASAKMRAMLGETEPSTLLIDTYLHRQLARGLKDLRARGFGPIVGFGQAWYPARYRSPFARVRALLPLWLFLRKLDRHIVVSEALAADYRLIGIPRSRVDVVLPGFDLDALRPGGERADGRMHVMTAGTYMEAKGQHLFVESAERLASGSNAREARLRFSAIGSKTQNPGFVLDLESRARRLPEGLVELEGAASQEKLWARMRESDVFVFPASGEGFGMVVVEAMLCGAVPIVSDDGPLREIVGENGEAGLVVGRSGTAIARAIDSLSKDPERMARMRKATRARALAIAPTWERSVTRIDSVLRDATGTGGAGLFTGGADWSSETAKPTQPIPCKQEG